MAERCDEQCLNCRRWISCERMVEHLRQHRLEWNLRSYIEPDDQVLSAPIEP